MTGLRWGRRPIPHELCGVLELVKDVVEAIPHEEGGVSEHDGKVLGWLDDAQLFDGAERGDAGPAAGNEYVNLVERVAADAGGEGLVDDVGGGAVGDGGVGSIHS